MDAQHQHIVTLLNEATVNFSLAEKSCYEMISQEIGDARIVLLGEATHGTHEFYQARSELSQYLIQEKGFQAIAIEGDWPRAYAVHNHILGNDKTLNAKQSLSPFAHFPTWMWRNDTVLSFIEWLKNYNDNTMKSKVGFYGLDLYSLDLSIKAVIDYLLKVDPIAAKKAIHRYACFDYTANDPQSYGLMIEHKVKQACIREVTEQLLDMQHLAFSKIQNLALSEAEALFYAMQNARLVKNAEEYYRALFESHEQTWNIRDHHMAETLLNLIAHLETVHNKPAKVIVWAHNSHVGDARATEMITRQEVNLGQLVRQNFNLSSYTLGFSTYTGTVTAASTWGQAPECKTVLPALAGSYEALFHYLKRKDFMLFLRQNTHLNQLLASPRLQRAIGVVYRPESERYSHYFFSHLSNQFDAIIHIDETTAVKPLD